MENSLEILIFVLSITNKTSQVMENLLEQIELLNEENTFDVFFDFQKKIFVAVENTTSPKIKKYKLTSSEEDICENHRDEILTYCLCSYTKDDSIGLGDIFIHGKYIEEI